VAQTIDRIECVSKTVIDLPRLLSPVLFTIASSYDVDPALQMPVLPGLARVAELVPLDPVSSEYRLPPIWLVRPRNRIADTLRRTFIWHCNSRNGCFGEPSTQRFHRRARNVVQCALPSFLAIARRDQGNHSPSTVDWLHRWV
jgi:hypothetical protein